MNRGEKVHWARLNDAIVREIRSCPLRFGLFTELAAKYGVSAVMIGKIYHRKRWKHIA